MRLRALPDVLTVAYYDGLMICSRFSRLYVLLLSLRYKGKPFARRIVRRETDITLEGFPRSGNSFANRVFRATQPETLALATHTHSAAQVQVSARYGIPTMVVFREPIAAITSLLALRLQKRGASTSLATQRMAAHEFRRYIDFHERVLQCGDDVFLVEFGSLTQDFGYEMRQFNNAFGTTFTPFDHTAENEAAVFAAALDHLSPNEERDRLKRLAKPLVDRVPDELVAAAQEIYVRTSTTSRTRGAIKGPGGRR